MRNLHGTALPSPIVTVVIPHFNDLDGLNLCLGALETQSIGRDAFKIVVADNCSPQGPAEVTKAVAGRAELVYVEERGAGPARNRGAALATTEYLAFTDSDCVPEARWLEHGLSALWTPSGQPDFIGGAMEVIVADSQRLTAAEAFECLFAFDNKRYVEKKSFTVTANLICPKAVFEHVGGFRNGVSEDLDWCLRAREAGYRIAYAEKAIVGHPARRTWDQLRKKWSRLQRESAALMVQRNRGLLRWFVRSWLILLSIFPDAVHALRSPKLTSFSDRCRALLGLVAIRTWRFIDAQRVLFKLLRGQL